MTLHNYLRIALWLPLIVPAATAWLVHVLGVQPSGAGIGKVVQLVLMMGIYGGIPYFVLVAYGTWWIGDRPEAELWHRARRAPVMMLVLWLLFSAMVGIMARDSTLFAGFFALGAAATLTIGYGYLGAVFLAWRILQRRDRTNRAVNAIS